MKCPTCGYIGFETAERCRNCGYDLTAAAPAAAPDLSIREREPLGPLSEFALEADVSRAEADDRAPAPDLDKVLQNLDRVLGASPPPGTTDLPLFSGAEPRERERELPPLVTPAPPRRPLAVRRTTPNPAKLRPKPTAAEAPAAPRALELPLPADAEAADVRGATVNPPPADTTDGAPPILRSLAALIDLTILGGIDVIVVYFTLRLCGLTTAEIAALPLVPLVAFFLVLNGGYLVAFTAAGGQTIGKMATGLKVVGHADVPVSTGLSLIRAAGCIGSICSLGLGYVPALLADGGRALEDRLADTRVIRVPAS